jgi:hypothetical protein
VEDIEAFFTSAHSHIGHFVLHLKSLAKLPEKSGLARITFPLLVPKWNPILPAIGQSLLTEPLHIMCVNVDRSD